MEETKTVTEDLFRFIEKGVSPFHVIAEVERRLQAAGFQALCEMDSWQLRAGGKYYTTRNASSLIAFAIPEGRAAGFQITASHSDSPTFKIKENPEMTAAGSYVKLNVEKYGGMIYSTWFDRPLSVAGRLVLERNGHISTRLYDAGRDLVMIPNLAIHMGRDVNDGHKYNAQAELMPVFGTEGADFKAFVAEDAGLTKEEIIDMDLFLYNRQQASIWGEKEEFASSPKLDDLQCAYGALEGFIAGQAKSNVLVYALFDNEEVGSGTKQGAESTFLVDTLRRIAYMEGVDPERYATMVARSFMISADNAHGIHPNYTDKADPTNQPKLNGGVVIKYNANQKYTTDAVSGAVLKQLCAGGDIPYQTFTNRSDMAGGSTLGNISNTQVSLDTVDIGMAQWAMHSAYETCGTEDTENLIGLMKEFYTTDLMKTKDGWKLAK